MSTVNGEGKPAGTIKLVYISFESDFSIYKRRDLGDIP
jgi:hypothetical protein